MLPEKQMEDTQSRSQGFLYHPTLLREDWSQYLSTVPFEGGDILVNPSDHSSERC